LEELYLSNNQLTGAIPDFSALPHYLKHFDISGNLLSVDCNTVTEISPIECESLLEFYYSTNGTKWKGNGGWHVTNRPCSWYGVTCENGVTNIALHDNQLTGTIPDFSALPNLQGLSLSTNQLTGTIPDFSALPNLEWLFLSTNQLTGTIPNFSALPNLQELNLWNNQLTGAIPDFSALPNLQGLFLSSNQLTGAIPDFSALPNLQGLFLSSNQLTGAIPDFSALPNLESFSFYDNQLTLVTNCNAVTQISQVECESLLELYHSTNGAGWMYNNGWNMTNMPCIWYGVTCENGGVTEINLGAINNMIPFSNNLKGTIPNFKGLPHLQRLDLSSNQLTGAIPNFSALPQLKYLNLGSKRYFQEVGLETNQLTGAIPDFSTLPHLETLSLSYNQLTGAIPDFSALTELKYLDLRNNPICKGNINYAILPIKQAKGNDTTTWQEELDGFPNCPVSPAATVEMQLNESRYTTGNQLRLELQVNGQAMADLYVAIVFPDGNLMTIAYPLALSQLNAIQVYQAAVEIAGQKTYPIMDFPLPAGIPTGGYHACGVLVLAGKNHSEDNWIDKHCVGFEVY
jgi:Leucine-rich repeat (LRR) protein